MNIYICGVGGQGVGMLSETLLRAADYAGLTVAGVDTHGLAQRGGQVSSHLKIAKHIVSPLVMKKDADLVISLERHEAARGMNEYLKDGGALIFYDTVMQPLPVRLGSAEVLSREVISKEALRRSIKLTAIDEISTLPDPVMQNTVLLASVVKSGLLPELKAQHCLSAMSDLLSAKAMEMNRELFNNLLI